MELSVKLLRRFERENKIVVVEKYSQIDHVSIEAPRFIEWHVQMVPHTVISLPSCPSLMRNLMLQKKRRK
jgi:hypothetical protein